MGNTSSTEAGPKRPAHKLSKPRTGNPSTAGLLSPRRLSNASARAPDRRLSSLSRLQSPAPSSPVKLDGSIVQQDASVEEGVTAPVVKEKEKKRRSLFRSLSSQDTSSRRKKGVESTEPMPHDAGEQIDRARSMTYEYGSGPTYMGSIGENSPQPAIQASWSYNFSSYEAKRLLSTTEEVSSPREVAASVQSLEVASQATWTSSTPYPQMSSAPPSRVSSDLSLYMPVRRRSMIQTPGVATRAQSHRLGTKPSFRHSLPPTPSLSRHNSVGSESSRVLSMPPLRRLAELESVPRVATPCEADYKQIGSFKHGSLRIVNGVASPAESLDGEKETQPVEVADPAPVRRDYFSRSDGARTGTHETDRGDKLEIVTVQVDKLCPSQLSPVVGSVKEAGSARNSSETILSGVHLTASPQDYLAEIQFTPFELGEARALSPELQTTSKHSAAEDHLFDEDALVEYSSAEVLDVRVDPSAKSRPHRPRVDPDQAANSVVQRSDSGIVASPCSELSHRPLAKADSGYSSNVSLRSFTAKPPVAEKGHPSQKEDEDRPPVPSPISNVNAAEVCSSVDVPMGNVAPVVSSTEKQLVPVPGKDTSAGTVSSGIAAPVPATAQSFSKRAQKGILAGASFSRKSRKSPAPVSATITPEEESSPAIASQVSPTESLSSSLSIGSGSHKPSKLQRLLSNSGLRGPPTVHARHLIDKADIPSVPSSIEEKLQERSGLFPVAPKRLTLRTHVSRDTLKTIFSVGSVECGAENGSRPISLVSEQFSLERSSIVVSERKTTLSHASSPVVPKKPIDNPLLRRSLTLKKELEKKPERKPSRTTIRRSQDSLSSRFEAEATTYTSINNALGRNPYDAAFLAMADERSSYFSLSNHSRTATPSSDGQQEARQTIYRTSSANSLVGMQPTGNHWGAPNMLPPRSTTTPPPVSMMTRNKGSLRVPSPLRTRSSVNGVEYRDRRSLSRKSSRESIHSYPAAQSGNPRGIESALLSSSAPTKTVGYLQVPKVGPTGLYRAPGWDVQSAYDAWHSNRSSAESSRHNSLSSQDSGMIPRPRSVQPYGAGYKQGGARLRHYSSYDGQPSGPRRGDYGFEQIAPPSQGPQSFKPRNQGMGSGQWGHGGGQPPYVPRAHHRHRSLGGHGGNAPYRILHSYNSPAYRNAPIWG